MNCIPVKCKNSGVINSSLYDKLLNIASGKKEKKTKPERKRKTRTKKSSSNRKTFFNRTVCTLMKV